MYGDAQRDFPFCAWVFTFLFLRLLPRCASGKIFITDEKFHCARQRIYAKAGKWMAFGCRRDAPTILLKCFTISNAHIDHDASGRIRIFNFDCSLAILFHLTSRTKSDRIPSLNKERNQEMHADLIESILICFHMKANVKYSIMWSTRRSRLSANLPSNKLCKS